MNLYIITLNYCKYQLDNLNKQVNNIVVKNINLQLNNINQINNYIKLNFNYKNKIYLILKDKYIYFNNNYLLLIKNLNKYKFYKFNNNWLINYNNNNNNINQIEINNKISKKFTRIDYESNLYNKSLVFLYNNGNNKRDIVVYNNLMNKKYPTNIINIKNITINKKILISIFLDKKVGFQDIFFNKLINIDYGNNNGINITLNVYNGYNKYKFLENNIKYFLKNSKIKDCEFNFYNFENLDINIDIQSTKIRISNLKYFNNLNFDYNFIIDNSHILDCKEIFKKLYMQNKDLCVPYLYQEKTKWSNFWLDYDENGYYLYNDNYENILNLNVKNIIKIPYFYGTILINKSIFEVYDISEAYNNNLWSIGDYDMAFCSNLRHNEIDINLLCDIKYGRILKLNEIKKYWDKNYSDIYLLKDSRIDWCNKYLSKNILENIDNLSKIKYSEYITDLFDFNFFTAKFCEELIYICEDYNNWSNGQNIDDRLVGGHENVPTIDIHLNQIGLQDVWDILVNDYISKLASHFYSNFVTKNTNIVFVVKYSLDGQKELSPHHDASSYSCLFTLNHDFEGGGTHFLRQNYTTSNLPIGNCSIHPGKLTHYHSGLPITKGLRYILVAFIY